LPVTPSHLTAKGAATRDRIVEAAADLLLAHGVSGTSLDDIGAGTATSKGQLFHYFPGGKNELISAIAEFQAARVLQAQRPWLDELDTWESWDHWRDAVVSHYRSQPHWGCPIGALSAELVNRDPSHAEDVLAHMERWRRYLRDGLVRMQCRGLLRSDADPERLALATFAALHGGLLLTQTMSSIVPLEAALDGALASLRSYGSDETSG
jgi:AcrR family transcriptional regulator